MIGKRQYWKELLFAGLAFLIAFTLACVVYRVTPFNVAQPILYAGADEMSAYKQAKMLTEGWIITNPRIGAPGAVDYAGYPVQMTHNFDTLLLLPLLWLTGNRIIAAANLQMLSLFGLSALSAYLVLRQLRVSRIFSLAGAVTFGLSPYMFQRGLHHLELTACEFIPVSILLCLWLYQDERLFRLQKGFASYGKNWAALILLALLAQNGLTYYPFFTCFFLLLTALIAALERKSAKPFLKGVFMSAVVVLSLGLALLPVAVAKLNGTLPQSSVVRFPMESEMYGLKLIQMILPTNARTHGLPFLTEISNEYTSTAPFINENQGAYLGYIGIIGLVVLAAVLFGRREKDDRMKLFSKLMLGGFLLGTIGGISAIIAYAVTSSLRAYNRVSPFLLFLCIAAVCILLTRLPWKTMKFRIPAFCCAIGLFGLSVWDQTSGGRIYAPQTAYTQQYNSDRTFVEEIEASVPEGSMIFQLPYQVFPDGGVVNNMQSQALIKGFLFSDTLRWSYGTIRNSEADLWCSETAALPVEEMIETLKERGFAGIYLDTTAYQPEELAGLRDSLDRQLGEAMVSDQGDLLFWTLDPPA